MNTLREVAQFALDALHCPGDSELMDRVERKLRAALAEQEQEQEPVAWVCAGSCTDEKHAIDYEQDVVDALPLGTMLYTTPQPRREVELTYEEIYECERLAAIRHQRHKHSIRGQQITPADDLNWHFARAVIAAYEAKNGITKE